ncbi:Sterol-4-alpha-carboxylate 3-dehydrogenase decarboxylating [Bienertia sinuspersici]
MELPITHKLTCTGCFLNPRYMYGSHDIGNDQELLKGVKNADLEIRARYRTRSESITHLYKDKMDSFASASASAQKAITLMDPGMNFSKNIITTYEILSQTTSSSHCERNWSIWTPVHTKTRKCLKYKRFHSIVYLCYNIKLKMRHLRRRSNDEINASFDPINLDYILYEDSVE